MLFVQTGCESIVHICFDCVKAQQMWNDLSNMIFNSTTITVNFNMKSVLFGETPYSCNQPVNSGYQTLHLYMLKEGTNSKF